MGCSSRKRSALHDQLSSASSSLSEQELDPASVLGADIASCACPVRRCHPWILRETPDSPNRPQVSAHSPHNPLQSLCFPGTATAFYTARVRPHREADASRQHSPAAPMARAAPPAWQARLLSFAFVLLLPLPPRSRCAETERIPIHLWRSRCTGEPADICSVIFRLSYGHVFHSYDSRTTPSVPF